MKKLLAILLALVLVAGMLAIPAAADPTPVAAPSFKVYSLALDDWSTFSRDSYDANKAEFDLNGTWTYFDDNNNCYLFVELLDEGWEFDFGQRDQETFADDGTADFHPIWFSPERDAEPTLGKNVMALSLLFADWDGVHYNGIHDPARGGTIHYTPRVVHPAANEVSELDVRVNVRYGLYYEHRYWDNFDCTALDLRPGWNETLRILKDGADVSASVTLVDRNLDPLDPDIAVLEPARTGENGNASEEEEREGWYKLRTEHCFSGYIKWTDGGETCLLPVECSLPAVGFYTADTAADEGFIRDESYAHRDNGAPIYLILNAGSNFTLELNGRREADWITWTEVTPGRVWRIDLDGSRLQDWDHIFVDYELLYKGSEHSGGHENLNVLNATPGLRFCWPDWGQNGLVPRLDDPDRLSQETNIPAPGNRTVQLVMLDYDGEGRAQITPLTWEEISRITMSENGEGVVKMAWNGDDDGDDGNNFVELDVRGWIEGEDPVVFTYRFNDNDYHVYLYTELPEFGFYSTPTPSKESYLGEWIFDGTEETAEVYFAYYGNWRNVNIYNWNVGRSDDVRIDVNRVDGLGDVLRVRAYPSGYSRYNVNIAVWGDSDDGGFGRNTGIDVYDRTSVLQWQDGDWGRSDLGFEVPESELGKWYVETNDFWLDTPYGEHKDDLDIPDQTIKNGDGEELLQIERFDSGKYRITALAYGDGALEYEYGGVTYRMPVSIQKQVVLQVEDAYVKAGDVAEVRITPLEDFDYSSLALVVDYDESFLSFEDAENGASFKEVASSEEEQAAVEEGDSLFIYNTKKKRLIWMPSAAENQTSVTAKAGVPLATLKFQVRDVTSEEEYNYDAYVRLQFYRGQDNNEWEGDYSYLADANGNRERLCLGCYQGMVRVLDHTPGDVNGDEKVNMQDVTAMLRWHVGYNDVGIQENALDTNGDGAANLWDVTWLLRYLSKWDNIVLQ